MLTILFLLTSLLSPALTAQANEATPVVRGVMFWMEGCPHCHDVLDNVLPPLQQEHGASLDIRLVEVITSDDFNQLVSIAAEYGYGSHEVGVPFLIIGDATLIGSDQIARQLPRLIDTHLAAGGVDFPRLPSIGIGPSGDVAAVAGAPSVNETAGVGLRWNGFRLAVAIMIGMVAALIYAGVVLWRGVNGTQQRRTPRWMEFAFVPLALAGLGVAAYLAYVETQTVAAICGPVGDCNAVQMSPYATLFGVLPIGVLGVVGYLSMLALWLWRRLRDDALASHVPALLFGTALFGVLFSLYLTYLEPFVIGAVCIWCLTSAVIMTLLLLLTVKPAVQAINGMGGA